MLGALVISIIAIAVGVHLKVDKETVVAIPRATCRRIGLSGARPRVKSALDVQFPVV